MDKQNYTYADESGLFNGAKMSRNNGLSATVKLSDWCKYDLLKLLNIIPVIGNILYIIIACIIAFGDKTAPSVKTRMQMSLIWAVAAVCFYIVLIVIALLLGFSFAGIFSGIINNLY